MSAAALFLLITTVTLPTLPANGATPAERRITRARQALEVAPDRADAHVELAFALGARARETSDPRYYDEGQRAVQEALRISPGSFEAAKARVWLRLGRHEFEPARVEAEALRERAPDDPLVYAFLVDAHVELGNYREAEEAAQWLLNLRSGGVASLTRVAYLRELFGDLEGARELMQRALERTSLEETEDRSWLLTQIAHLHLLDGHVAEAERAVGEALATFPDYHYALALLARVRTAQGRAADAADLLRRRHEAAPHPENLYELAVALKRAGRSSEARETFRRFETAARAEMEGHDNANRELIFYYADHARRPAEALRVATLESRRRRDVYTRAAYAWALHVNGRRREARAEMNAALAVGVRDPEVLRRARVIGARAAR